MTIAAHPLTWPADWKRTPDDRRRDGHFGKRATSGAGYRMKADLTVNEAVQRVLAELQRWAIGRDDVVISTNVPTRLDGLPRSDARKPQDPGAAVYWEEPGHVRRCIAVDQYKTVEDNLAAIAATLDAMRAIERHGGAAVIERAFTGFTALPAPATGTARTWWEVLGVERATATREECKIAHRALASQFHPDRPGGSNERMAEVNVAIDQALQEVFR
jgi:hypothetical protein